MSEKDRIIYRILNLLSNDSKIPALCKLKPATFIQKSNSSATWILGASSLPSIYTTLMHFPCWRSALPQPLGIESYKSRSRYLKELQLTIDTLTNEWALTSNIISNSGNTKDDYGVHVDGSDGSDDDAISNFSSDDGVDEDGNELDDEINFSNQNISTIDCIPIIDPFNDNSSLNGVYDPSFWLPCLHYLLHSQDVSIRQLSNCGLLSLVFVSLGSNCPILRSYSLSCLSSILSLLKKQTPDKDPAFRERPQLLLLVNFVRNGFDIATESSDTKCLKLPMSTALFAARAALHLMQPSHELYPKINKYLLSRPYCDIKDIPLYDFSVLSGNNESFGDILIQLSTLRLVRDGLSTKEDHLNLCRKNAYSRLMMMFRIVSNVDIKCGHAILDLFEKASTIKDSARYLIERCGIVIWLQQIASLKYCIVESTVIENDSRIYTDEKKSKISINEVPLKLLSRSIVLLRRMIAADFMLSCEGVKSKAMSFFRCLCFIVDEVITLDETKLSNYIPDDFIKQLVVAIWDCSLISSVDCHLDWGMSRLYRLAKAIPNIIVGLDDSSQSTRSDLTISILSLISFKSRVSECMISDTGHNLSYDYFPPLLDMMMSSIINLLFTTKSLPDKAINYVCIFPQESVVDESKVSSSAKVYSCILHLFHNDFKNVEIFDLQQNIRNTWTVLPNFDMNNPVPPCNGDMTVGICSIMSKSMINCLVFCIGATNDENFLAVDTSNSIFRFILSIKLTLSNAPSVYLPDMNKNTNWGIKKRVYSIIDGGVDLFHYDNGYHHFQLLYRLTILGVINLLLRLPSWLKSDQRISIINSFLYVVHIFLGYSYDYEDTSNPSVLLNLLKSCNKNFDGMLLWDCILNDQLHTKDDASPLNSNNIKNIYYDVCYLCLDIVGSIVSMNDRLISSETNPHEHEMTDKIYIILHGPKALIDMCNMLASTEILSEKLSSLVSIPPKYIDDLFESSQNSGNKNSRINSNWKSIPKQSRDGIINGMKSGRNIPLAGNVNVAESNLEL